MANLADAYKLDESPSTISEMRDCLTPILTSATIARSFSLNSQQDAALQILERQALRLARLLDRASNRERAQPGRRGRSTPEPADEVAH